MISQDTASTIASGAFESAPGSPVGFSASLQEKCVNTVRVISAALPQQAKSGHPGAPAALAAIAHALYGRIMHFAPDCTDWIARDRFVLSNGHACALQYTMLHLLGYDVTLEDLKAFRQLDSKTPGHPERLHTAGVEVSTGPLGQGVAQGVGLAIAGTMMAHKYNKPDLQLFNNHVYVVAGDGCMQEGIASEAASLAGHLRLNRLVVLYDKNKISIDGDTDLSFTEDVPKRFEAYGWNVLHVKEAHIDVDGIVAALQKARNESDRPTLIVCETIIGYGSQKQGTEKVHGSPLGMDDLMHMRVKFGLPSEDIFYMEPDVLEAYRKRGEQCNALHQEWLKLLDAYRQQYPEEAADLEKRIAGKVPDDLVSSFPKYTSESKANSTRALSGIVLNVVAARVPWLVGGSADLTGSNSCEIKGAEDFQAATPGGRYIRFGVREHAMAAICNGIISHGGFMAFAATFLNFIGYAWGAVRLSALSKLNVLFIATHDSIELGEDGATHQPVELAAVCRATPNLAYVRPADGNEVSGAYASWLAHPLQPVVLALCRNAVPQLQGSSAEGVMKGAYVLQDFHTNGKPGVVLVGNGSELHMCVEAAKLLESDFSVRVVSMPCWEYFLEQSVEYQKSVIPKDCAVKKLYVEAASTLGCERFCDASIGMTIFGASAPRTACWEKYGYTPANIAARVRSMV